MRCINTLPNWTESRCFPRWSVLFSRRTASWYIKLLVHLRKWECETGTDSSLELRPRTQYVTSRSCVAIYCDSIRTISTPRTDRGPIDSYLGPHKLRYSGIKFIIPTFLCAELTAMTADAEGWLVTNFELIGSSFSPVGSVTWNLSQFPKDSENICVLPTQVSLWPFERGLRGISCKFICSRGLSRHATLKILLHANW